MPYSALKYPKQGDNWVRRCLIGGLLVVGSFLLVPGILLSGYMLRVLRESATNQSIPPGFSDVKGLFVDGLRWLVVSFIYILIPSLFAFFGTVVIQASFVQFSLTMAFLITALVVLATLSFYLVAGYLLLISLTNLAINGTMRSAFDRSVLIEVGRSRTYAKAWVGWLAFVFLGGFLSGALSLFFVGFFLYFYLLVAGHSLVARGFSSSLGKGPSGQSM